MKTLNIDALAKSNRTLTLGGKTYEVQEMTVENFIETTKAAEKLGPDASFVEQVEATIDMIQRHVPLIERSVLKKLSLEQLTTITQFVRGELDGDAKTPEAGPQEGDSAEGK